MNINQLPQKPTIGIVTALPKEHVAVEILLQNVQDISVAGLRGNRQYKIGEVPILQGGSHLVVLALLPHTGTNMASIWASHLLSDFPSIQDIIMVGIAGGIPHPEKPDEHVRLGDIVVSDEYGTIQYDYGKKTSTEWISKPFPRPPSPNLLHAVKLLESAELKGNRPWLRYIEQAIKELTVVRPSAETDILASSSDANKFITHPDDKKRHQDHPRVFRGSIAASNTLLKDSILRDELRNRYCVKAVEMEGAGIADATWDHRVGNLIIRGICDYGDANKNDIWQDYAAVVAAAYTRALLETVPNNGSGEDSSTPKKDSADQNSSSSPSIWNAPYSPNLYFTGRESILTALREALVKGNPTVITQPYAIYGLGGIGKTQTALQYAHLHRSDYHSIFWFHADSHESLINDYFNLADVLSLSVRQEKNPDRIITEVKRWFQTQDNWLLVFDNVENLEMVSSFFPAGAKGHILLTTRLQATGTIAQVIRLENMTVNEGAFFLLRRAKLISFHTPFEQINQADRQKAQEISGILSGFPLALDQAGAYIEETKCSLTEYLELYEKRRSDLLRRRGTVSSGHPDSVATTFSLLCERVKNSNNGSIVLLQLCAFLHADAIPIEIICSEEISRLVPELQPVVNSPFERNIAIEELLKHSLLYRDTNANIFTIHRLVQTVIKDSMAEDEQRHWAELTIKIVNHAFPHSENYTTWPICQRYLPHAQACVTLMKQWKLTMDDTINLLNKIANYTFQRGDYSEVESLFQLLLTIHQSKLGSEQPDIDTITIMSNIAGLHRMRGNYIEAEKVYLQLQNICENIKNMIPESMATIYTGLGVVYEKQGRYSEAKQLHNMALTFRLQEGEETLKVATCLNDLAMVNKYQENFQEAEELYLRVLKIRKKFLQPNHPSIAESLNNIAVLYQVWGNYQQAEEYALQALHIKEQIYEPNHPRMATSYNNLANLYRSQGKNSKAILYYRKAILICDSKLGSDHPDTKSTHADYEELLKKMNEEN